MRSKTTWLATGVAISALAVPPVGAVAADASTASEATTARQLRKLQRQVTRLRRQVASLTQTSGPAGPQGPEGPAGAPGPQGPANGPAGGDLTGSYPNPEIAEQAIGTPELAANAIRHDTNPANAAFGNYTSRIGPSAIGRNEIADGEIRATEFGALVVRTATDQVSGNSEGTATALCADGEQLISGGAQMPGWPDLRASIATADFDGWTAKAWNNLGGMVTLTVHAYCLA